MKTVMLVIVAAVVATLVAACGDGDDAGLDRRPTVTARSADDTLQPQDRAAEHARDLIVFRRIRYEGATLRTLYLRRDGSMDIEVPGGGAGGSRYTGRVTGATLRAVKRLVARTPWDALSAHRVTYDRSGAYFMLRHGGEERIAMAAHMSRDLVPLVDRLNGILNGEGRAEHRAIHRFFQPS
jgi:hypothetical protein